jgi:hypothetical protein
MSNPKRRPKRVKCRRCKKAIKVAARGPLPLYCSGTCRQLAYQQRRHSGPMLLLAQDIATYKVRSVIRQEYWRLPCEAGLVGGDPPRPKPAPHDKKPGHLRLVPPAEK